MHYRNGKPSPPYPEFTSLSVEDLIWMELKESLKTPGKKSISREKIPYLPPFIFPDDRYEAMKFRKKISGVRNKKNSLLQGDLKFGGPDSAPCRSDLI